MSESERSGDAVHVFVGQFPSRAAACGYTEAQWEPEPDESASDDDHDAWEERNPSWALRTDLDVYLDSDFIETIDGDERYSYIEGILENGSAISEIRRMAPKEANICVLIYREALGGRAAELKSTDKLTYCGEYPCGS